MLKSSLVMCGVLVIAISCRETPAAEVLRIAPESGSIEFVGAKDDGTHIRGGHSCHAGKQ